MIIEGFGILEPPNMNAISHTILLPVKYSLYVAAVNT